MNRLGIDPHLESAQGGASGGCGAASMVRAGELPSTS